jgi:hypothetical protein
MLLNCTKITNFKDCIKVFFLIKENYELIEEYEYFEKLKLDND